MKAIYTAEATAGGGRHDGYARSSDGKIDMRILPPVELGGPDEPATNPEQLFAAGYASCFNNSVILVARRMKLDAEDSEVTAKVDLGVAEKGRFDLAVRLEVKVPKLGARGRTEPDRDGAQGVPVLARDARQHRGRGRARRLTSRRATRSRPCPPAASRPRATTARPGRGSTR